MKCLESIISQKGFEEYEIIVVNDGTPDRSIDFIRNILQSHSNIQLIEQENKGQSEARNVGLLQAKGEFISFVDSDDWIEETMISELYNAAKSSNSDMAICNITKVFIENNSVEMVKMESGLDDRTVISNQQAVEYYFQHTKINGYACNKIYRRQLFIDHQISFPLGKIYEDLPTVFQLLWYSKRIVFLKSGFYRYLQRSGSSTQALNMNLWHLIENLYLIKAFLISQGAYEKYREKFLQLVITDLFLIHVQLQKNKKAPAYPILKGNLLHELKNIHLMAALTSADIHVAAKIKLVLMKFQTDYIVDVLLMMNRMRKKMASYRRHARKTVQ